ncbi:MAG: Maf-like protein [Betaproteobacteria bacterium]|nr:septum formation protein Maf [Rhodocyclaceae bacterium]
MTAPLFAYSVPTQPLILASTSPFRKALLDRLGLPFDIVAPDVDESAQADESPSMQASRLARTKAAAVSVRHPTACVIGSDQVAHSGGRRYGKPGSRARAIEQLLELSCREVMFETAVCLAFGQHGPKHEALVPTTLKFRQLSLAEIERYVDRDDPIACAGAAKSESLGIALLEWVRSDDPTALIGLPLIALSTMLRQAGYVLP